MKNHLYKFNEIVLGATAQAVNHAFENKIPIFFVKRKEPIPFLFLNIENLSLDAYKKKLYTLSLIGKVPFYDNVESIRIEDNILNIVTKDSRVINIEFDKATIFDEEGLIGIEPPEKIEQPQYIVLDWFNVRSGMCHDQERIESTSDFVKCIHFYPSDRIDGAHDKKDLVAISILSEDQLYDIAYSEIYVKFKVLHLMQEAGIAGAKNGTSPSGKPRRHQLKIESDSRDIREITRPIYKDTEYLKFNYTATEWNRESKI